MPEKLLSLDKLPQDLFLNNELIKGGANALKLVNPKDGHTLISHNVYEATESQVDQAVAHAQAAFEGPWAAYTGEQKSLCLNKLADLILEHTEEIAYFESICTGRPLFQTRREIPRVVSVFRYYAGWCDKIKGDSYPPEDGFYKIVRQEPLGVCAGITAWNASLHFFSWKAGPALACGNTIIIKPSEKAPLGTMACAYLAREAGFPPGVLQVVVGGAEVGALLAAHMRIAKISFTGSTSTGKKIQDAATKSNLKRVTLELGGKSPAIVFDDCDIQKTLFWCKLGITINAGQVCAATSRIFVQDAIAEKFLTLLKEQFESIAGSLGADPQDLTTQYGPLVDQAQYEKVLAFIEEGKACSKTIVGGEKYGKHGYYVAPTIFLDPPENSAIYREEIFGPVLCARTFKTEEEAIKLANDTQYGLAGSIYTQDVNRALRVSSKVRGGTIGVNCSSVVGPQVPMGGFGSSGIGRELGEYAIRHYTETKTVWIK
ncbi:hypothetical protein MBLNU459_g7074t2 [Dothideomycetes sp. NU459]